MSEAQVWHIRPEGTPHAASSWGSMAVMQNVWQLLPAFGVLVCEGLLCGGLLWVIAKLGSVLRVTRKEWEDYRSPASFLFVGTLPLLVYAESSFLSLLALWRFNNPSLWNPARIVSSASHAKRTQIQQSAYKTENNDKMYYNQKCPFHEHTTELDMFEWALRSVWPTASQSSYPSCATPSWEVSFLRPDQVAWESAPLGVGERACVLGCTCVEGGWGAFNVLFFIPALLSLSVLEREKHFCRWAAAQANVLRQVRNRVGHKVPFLLTRISICLALI